ncbi:MAG: hypothetical protein NVSMB46_02720 [Candidatus Saccharimonadales bacterium]
MIHSKNNNGFTLIELILVISVIGILAAITISAGLPNWREHTALTAAHSELHMMSNATTLYVSKYNAWPPDTARGVDPGITEFLGAQASRNIFGQGPWKGSMYDWNNWPPDPTNGPLQTYEIEIMFCQPTDPISVCQNNFPKEPWVGTNWDQYSGVYYCIKGSCRSQQSSPNHPGYCINCGGKSQFY